MSHLVADVRYNLKEGRLIVDDTSLILLSYKVNHIWFAIAVQFGLLGGLLYALVIGRKKKKMLAQFQQGDARQIAASDKESLVIDFEQIESFELPTGWFKKSEVKLLVGEKKITVQMSKEEREQLASLLRSKCGGREKQK